MIRACTSFAASGERPRVVREDIAVKGRSKPERVDITITHHGPIVNDAARS